MDGCHDKLHGVKRDQHTKIGLPCCEGRRLGAPHQGPGGGLAAAGAWRCSRRSCSSRRSGRYAQQGAANDAARTGRRRRRDRWKGPVQSRPCRFGEASGREPASLGRGPNRWRTSCSGSPAHRCRFEAQDCRCGISFCERCCKRQRQQHNPLGRRAAAQGPRWRRHSRSAHTSSCCFEGPSCATPARRRHLAWRATGRAGGRAAAVRVGQRGAAFGGISAAGVPGEPKGVRLGRRWAALMGWARKTLARPLPLLQCSGLRFCRLARPTAGIPAGGGARGVGAGSPAAA
jgi:hypothetical protein